MLSGSPSDCLPKRSAEYFDRTGVNLLRVDSSGKTLSILGQLHDSGENGDAAASDHIFSIQVSFNELGAGQMFLRVSAPFQGLLQRVLSNIIVVTVTPLQLYLPTHRPLLRHSANSPQHR
jgi:hypothetical protein